MSSHILDEREVARHNLRGRTFVVRRIVWDDSERPSFDVDDLATGACLTEESFDNEPGPEEILALLERLLFERSFHFVGPVIPNDPELDRFIDQELRATTWWYVPLRTLEQARGGGED